MNPLQNCKFVKCVAPVSSAGAYTETEVDCKGYHYATFIFHTGVVGAADFVALKIQGGNVAGTVADLTSGSITYITTANGVASTGLNFIGTGQTPGDTTEGIFWIAHIDLRKATYSGATDSGVRFLNVVAEAGAASLFTAICILSDADDPPSTATAAGAQSMQIL